MTRNVSDVPRALPIKIRVRESRPVHTHNGYNGRRCDIIITGHRRRRQRIVIQRPATTARTVYTMFILWYIYIKRNRRLCLVLRRFYARGVNCLRRVEATFSGGIYNKVAGQSCSVDLGVRRRRAAIHRSRLVLSANTCGRARFPLPRVPSRSESTLLR